MIYSTHLNNFRNNEMMQFFTDVVKICEQNNAGTLLIEPQVMALKQTVNSMVQIANKDKGSNITEELVAYDGRRDAALQGIKNVADGFTYHFDESLSTPAKLIVSIIEKLGKSITRLNYQAETSVLNNLVNDWETNPELSAAITKLKLNRWMQELKSSNTTFNEKYLTRIKEEAESPQVKIPELRAKAVDEYRNLVNNITARATLSTNNEYKALIDQLNVLIEKYNDLINARASKAESEN